MGGIEADVAVRVNALILNRAKIEQPIINYNICSDSSHRISSSCLTHSLGPCEWVASEF